MTGGVATVANDLSVDRLRGYVHVALIACLLVGALALRLEGITKPSVESRELHNALIARQYYLGDGEALPAWQRRVLRELGNVAQPIEPPILDAIAATGYRVAGGERLWIPRLASSVAWIVGGVFLYLIALRLTTREGALVALAAYLFWPYAVWLSRLYMPDGTMVACLLAGVLAVIRYWERPTRARLVAAAGVASVASAVKPGVALIFLVALFAAIALSRRALRDAILGGALPLFAILAAALTVGYYVYGTYVQDFLAGETGGRVEPRLIATESFWRGWWEMVSTVLAFPQRQGYLAFVPLALAAGGLAVARSGLPRAVLVGLAAGYCAFALVVPGFTSTHAYYALPLVPLLALGVGTFAGWVIDRTRGRAAASALVALGVLSLGIGVYKGHAVLSADPPYRAIADYRRIGEITGHSSRAIVVDVRLRSPISYWGWMVGRYWYPPTPSRDLPIAGDPFPSWIDPAAAEFLVVVAIDELKTEPRLRALVRSLPIVAQTPRFVVFDLRGGRGSDVARG